MFLYRILTIILSPIILGHIVWLSIKNKKSRYFWQRLGFQYSHLPKNSLWFHCASVGEVNTLLPLLKNISASNKKFKIIVTTNTITGAKIIAQQNLTYLFHSYLPFDWRTSTNNFINTVQPLSVFIMETEIWPNLFDLCRKNHTPVSLINARLSIKTTSANNWIKSLLKNSLSKVETIHARSNADKLAYIKLGANKNRISTAGNLKLTTVINKPSNNSNTFSSKRKYILLASTHKNEELQFYKIWKELKRSELLIIVPRHPERSASIIKLLNNKNLALRSNNDTITNQTEIYIINTVGELKNYFQNAELVIMGGSFVPIGGHNILEPASFNSAIITGPYMDNFKEELALMLDKEAIVQVDSMDDLKVEINQLLRKDDDKNNLKTNTRELLNNSQEVLDTYTHLALQQANINNA